MRADEWKNGKTCGAARPLTITNANGRDELIYLLLIDCPLVAACESTLLVRTNPSMMRQMGKAEVLNVEQAEEGIANGGELLFAEFTVDRSINPFHLSAGQERDIYI